MRWKGLLLVAAFIIAGLVFANFYMDSFVKSNIESIGSDAVGAKVSLDSIDISIKKQSVSIKGLQVADPKAPLTNIMQLKSMNFDFSLPDLLMGSLIIENVSVDTPLFGTKRKTSGALPKKPEKKKKTKKEPEGALAKKAKSIAGDVTKKIKGKAEKIADAKTGGMRKELKKDVDWNQYLPTKKDIENFDAGKFVNPETMASLRELEEISKFVEGRDIYWKGRYKELEREFNALKTVPAINEVAKVSKYRKRLNAFVKKVEADKKEFQSDLDRLESARKNIEKLRNQDLKSVINIPGLASGNVSEISQNLFEDIYKDKLQTVLDRFDMYKTALADLQSSDEEKRMKGVTVHYPVRNPMPRFHLKKASFKIAADSRKGNWFSGIVKDVTSDPVLIGKATTFEMEGGTKGYPGALFSVKGKADYLGNDALYSLNILGENISTKLAENSLGHDSPVAIAGGSVIFRSRFNLEGNQVKSDFKVDLRDIEMSARMEGLKGVDPDIVRILDDSVHEVSYVNLKGDARGTPDKIKIRISSDLDKILKKVFAKMVAETRKEIEGRIREELDKEIKKRVPELQAMLKDDFGNIKSIEDVGASLKSRIDKEKKKLEDALKAKVEKKKKMAEEKLKAELEKKKKKAEKKLKEEAEKKLKGLFKF